jgi:hypothetical protein
MLPLLNSPLSSSTEAQLHMYQQADRMVHFQEKVAEGKKLFARYKKQCRFYSCKRKAGRNVRGYRSLSLL